MKLPTTLAALLFLAATLAAAAHEFWVRPSSFSASAGQKIDVRLFVGDGFPGEALGRNGPMIERFVAVGPKGETPINGRNGVDPAGSVTLADPGAHILVFRNLPSRLELEGEKFDKYLAEEGLDRIIAKRKEKGDSTKPGREMFSRCAKSIVRVDGKADGYDRQVKLRFEMTPENDPFTLTPGKEGADSLRLRAVFEEKPAAGRLVTARIADDPSLLIKGTTDDQGRVSFRLPRAGVWMISAVHMTEAPAGADADWESTWSSLTFELPSTTPATPAPAKEAAK